MFFLASSLQLAVKLFVVVKKYIFIFVVYCVYLQAYHRLHQQLISSCGGQAMEYNTFVQLLSVHFCSTSLPKQLTTALFGAIAHGSSGPVDINDVIGAIALFKSAAASASASASAAQTSHKGNTNGGGDNSQRQANRVVLMRFLYQAYDTMKGRGEGLERRRLGAILEHTCQSQEAVAAQLLDLFGKTRQHISEQEFYAFTGSVAVMVTWIHGMLSVFTDRPSTVLVSLERRYSLAQESEKMMEKYQVSKAECDKLRNEFTNKCYAFDRHSKTGELSGASWLEWTKRHLPRSLAEDIFNAEVDVCVYVRGLIGQQ